jgi:hypothetical protein
VDPDLHHFGNLDLHPDPHQKDKLDPEPDPDPYQFADDKPKCMEYEHFFKGLSLYLQARIWIRIRIRVISRIRIRIIVLRILNTACDNQIFDLQPDVQGLPVRFCRPQSLAFCYHGQVM